VLGYGSHPDPAAELLPVLSRITKEIIVVCHVLGTAEDPQNAETQTTKLRDAGAYVFTSHHAAADFAMRILQNQRRR
jgi:FdrA protein